MILEKDIEKYLKKEVKKLGGKALKFTSTEKGVPDQIVLLPNGDTIFVEVKKYDGVPAPVQVKMHKTFRNLKQQVFTVYSKKNVDVILTILEKEGRFNGV